MIRDVFYSPAILIPLLDIMGAPKPGDVLQKDFIVRGCTMTPRIW